MSLNDGFFLLSLGSCLLALLFGVFIFWLAKRNVIVDWITSNLVNFTVFAAFGAYIIFLVTRSYEALDLLHQPTSTQIMKMLLNNPSTYTEFATLATLISLLVLLVDSSKKQKKSNSHEDELQLVIKEFKQEILNLKSIIHDKEEPPVAIVKNIETIDRNDTVNNTSNIIIVLTTVSLIALITNKYLQK